MHAYHAIREKLRHKSHHPGHMLDLKTKDLIGSDQTLLFIFFFFFFFFLFKHILMAKFALREK